MRAWEYEHNKLHTASPADFEQDPSDWSGVGKILKARRELLNMHWSSQVPGSRAPESIFLAMIQAWYNQGYDVTEAWLTPDQLMSVQIRLFPYNGPVPAGRQGQFG